ncbi:hypothetical protein ACVIGB_001802 [Bradyrhizobium sp. USDA 4341]
MHVGLGPGTDVALPSMCDMFDNGCSDNGCANVAEATTIEDDWHARYGRRVSWPAMSYHLKKSGIVSRRRHYREWE